MGVSIAFLGKQAFLFFSSRHNASHVMWHLFDIANKSTQTLSIPTTTTTTVATMTVPTTTTTVATQTELPPTTSFIFLTNALFYTWYCYYLYTVYASSSSSSSSSPSSGVASTAAAKVAFLDPLGLLVTWVLFSAS